MNPKIGQQSLNLSSSNLRN